MGFLHFSPVNMVGRVYVGGLTYRVQERDLDRFFRSYGKLRDVILKNGFGFVEFDDERDADDAVYEMNGKELLGGRVTVERAKSTPRPRWMRGNNNHRQNHHQRNKYSRFGAPSRTDYRLAVENLSSRVSWQDLKDFMRQAGEVTYADAHKQRKNEGIVEFSTYSDMKNALIKLDGKDLQGRRVKLVDESRRSRRSRKSRSRSRSRSRSKSRSRSSSRSRSRSPIRSRSRSNSASRSRSISKSKSKSRSKSRSQSRSRKVRQNRQDSRSPSKSKSRSRSRSCSPRRSN